MQFKRECITTELSLLQKKQEETGIKQEIPKALLKHATVYA